MKENIYRNVYCGMVDTSYVGKDVRIAGWVNSIRNLGSIAFLTIRDEKGIVQVVTDNESKIKDIVRESTVTLTANGSITNPTDFESLPQLKVTGYGDMFIGTQKISIVDVYPYVIIDSDIGDCYYGTNNANAQVTFSMNDFPVLKSGANAITKDNTITQIDIVPRWWRV